MGVEIEFDEGGLKADIETWMKTFAYSYCKDAEREITREAKDAIQGFYDSYDPKFYDRTGNLKKSIEPYFKDNGTFVYGGVRLSPGLMADYKSLGRNGDKNIVFHSTWFEGYHTEGVMTFPPESAVRMFMGNPSFLSSITNTASEKAKNAGYSYLQFIL